MSGDDSAYDRQCTKAGREEPADEDTVVKLTRDVIEVTGIEQWYVYVVMFHDMFYFAVAPITVIGIDNYWCLSPLECQGGSSLQPLRRKELPVGLT